jgi:hypothetical protein
MDDACSYTSLMAEEDTVLEEAMDNLRKPGSASGRLRASCALRV